MPRELKLYELRSASRPGVNNLLSTTVAVRDANGASYYCYVRFSDRLVQAVGKKLPRGLTQSDPAYLYVQVTQEGFQVWARTHSEAQQVLLWTTSLETTPDWLKFYKTKTLTHGSTKPPLRPPP